MRQAVTVAVHGRSMSKPINLPVGFSKPIIMLEQQMETTIQTYSNYLNQRPWAVTQNQQQR